MNTPIITTFFFDEEKTDGHHPMKFLCEDDNIYYCKYLTQVSKDELDFLAYEVIANRLLKGLQVRTPEIALIKLSPDSVSKNDLKKNKRAYPDKVCFGSRQVIDSSLVNGAQMFSKRKEVNRFINARDIIRIAAFDLIVDNRDRGKRDNFNLLEAEVKENGKAKLALYAFDHAFIFGGQEKLRHFRPSEVLTDSMNLIETEYFKSFVRQIPKKERLVVLEEFITLYSEVYEDSFKSAIPLLHESWNIQTIVLDMAHAFLSNKKRLDCVSIKLNEFLKKV